MLLCSLLEEGTHALVLVLGATGSAFEAEAFGVTCGTEDKNEGMGAFLEKRAEKNFQNK